LTAGWDQEDMRNFFDKLYEIPEGTRDFNTVWTKMEEFAGAFDSKMGGDHEDMKNPFDDLIADMAYYLQGTALDFQGFLGGL
jgi:hypothetical protein